VNWGQRTVFRFLTPRTAVCGYRNPVAKDRRGFLGDRLPEFLGVKRPLRQARIGRRRDRTVALGPELLAALSNRGQGLVEENFECRQLLVDLVLGLGALLVGLVPRLVIDPLRLALGRMDDLGAG
jgi:hypothetical protein